jgi:hypothetical protein
MLHLRDCVASFWVGLLTHVDTYRVFFARSGGDEGPYSLCVFVISDEEARALFS